MQTALSRIWTRIAESTSYDDSCYVTSTSNIEKVSFFFFLTN